MSIQKVNSNSQLHAFQYQIVVLQITGNSNQIVLENCGYQVLVTGNGNRIMIIQNGQQSFGKKKTNTLSIAGNGNCIGFGGGSLKLKIKGNGNQIEGETEGLIVTQNDGFGNIVPECAKQKKVENSAFDKQQNVYIPVYYPMQPPKINKHSGFNIQQKMPSPDLMYNQANKKPTHNSGNFYQNSNHNFCQKPNNNLLQNPKNKHYLLNRNNYECKKSLIEQQFHQQPKNQMFPHNGYNRNGGFNFNGGFKNKNNDFFNQQTLQNKHRENKAISAKNLDIYRPNQRNNLNFYPRPQPVITYKQDFQDSIPLNQQELSRLQKSKHLGKSINCNICLQDIKSQDQEIYLLCFHSYHSKCILDWFRKSSKCPFCFCCVRKQIKQSSQYN